MADPAPPRHPTYEDEVRGILTRGRARRAVHDDTTRHPADPWHVVESLHHDPDTDDPLPDDRLYR